MDKKGEVTGLVEELKHRLKDLRHVDGLGKLDTDFYLLEWLKVKNMNVRKAEKALRKSFTWRMENEVVNPIQDFPEDLAFRLPIYEDGVSRNGIPVYAVSLKNWRVQSLIELEGKERLLRYVNLILLKMENRWLEHNLVAMDTIHQNDEEEDMKKWDEQQKIINVDKFICLIDAKEVSTNPQIPHDFQKKIVKSAEKYFPPIIQQVIFFNVSPTIYSMRGTLKQSKSIKVQIFNCDETKWKKAIDQVVAPKNLPIGFGEV